MDFFISAGVAWLIEALLDRKNVAKFADKFAKVFVKIEQVAESNAVLNTAILKQRSKG